MLLKYKNLPVNELEEKMGQLIVKFIKFMVVWI